MPKKSKKDAAFPTPEPDAVGSPDSITGMESIFQEVIRRGASLGFSSFFLTEEAIRRAFSDRVPSEWADYVSEQSESVRDELIERMSREFGNWLRTLDVGQIAADFLEEREVSLRIEIKPKRRSGDAGEDTAEDTGESLHIFSKK